MRKVDKEIDSGAGKPARGGRRIMGRVRVSCCACTQTANINTYPRNIVLEFTDDLIVLEHLFFILQESMFLLQERLYFRFNLEKKQHTTTFNCQVTCILG